MLLASPIAETVVDRHSCFSSGTKTSPSARLGTNGPYQGAEGRIWVCVCRGKRYVVHPLQRLMAVLRSIESWLEGVAVAGVQLPHARLRSLRECSGSTSSFHLFERIPDLVVLSRPHLLPLLRDHVFRPDLPRVLSHEFSDEARIPEFAGNAEIFAAAHQRVGLAPFGGGWDPVGAEVVLLATGYGNEATRLSA